MKILGVDESKCKKRKQCVYVKVLQVCMRCSLEQLTFEHAFADNKSMNGKAYSIDLREKVLQAVDEKKYTIVEVANLFNVSSRWITKIIRQRRETGSIAPLGHGGGRQSKFHGDALKELESLVTSQPDITMQEILDKTEVDASIMSVHRALEKLGFRRKKNRFGPLNRIAQM